MGEVYRATDTRLGRGVAVKVLPLIFEQDSERVARFEREARVLASLNHVNIATLYGIDKVEGKHLLVMELIEGDTLADRIARGPLPLLDALKIARQIADALEAAHQQGIVHRDLKPANVKVASDGAIKVLDFGLAKALAASPSAVDALSPTISVSKGTFAGVVLGTAAYMSPEQAKGAETDQRTDVFAFGCVLYEMLVGRRTFQGDTVTEAIASVLARDPDMTALPANASPKLHELLCRCLEKDPKRRWQAIGDVRVELDAIVDDPHGLKLASTGVGRQPLWKRVLPAAVAGVLAASITAAAAWMLRPPPAPAAITRFSFTLPNDQNFTRTGRHSVVISPDGANVVYVANNQLYLKPMAEMSAKPIPGTAQDINTPVFSPDGQWVVFCSVPEGKLKKVAITGGASVTLADIDNPYGVQWVDDWIYLGQGAKGIARVSASGGKLETIVTAKPGELAQGPQLLPDGDHMLFTVARGTAEDRWDKAEIVVQSIRTGERTLLIEGGSDARYVPTGHVVYALGSTVLAVPFNVKTRRLSGGPVPILEGIARSAAVNTAATNLSFSATGSMVSIPGTVSGGTGLLTLALVNRNGERKALPMPPSPYYHPRLSPDGRQIAVEINDNDKDVNIWVYELAGTTAMRRLTFGGRNRAPVWARDGQRIVFRSDRDGENESLYWQRADGSGAPERLTTADRSTGQVPESWSPDGSTLTFLRFGSSTLASIWMLPYGADRKPKPLVELPVKSASGRNSAFSPDGRWFAYESTESGTARIYVQPFPPTGAKYEISPSLGLAPVWSPDGKQLFYEEVPGGRMRLVAVEVRTQASLTFGKPTPLPIEGFTQRGSRAYDVTPDGKQFLVMLPPSETASGGTGALQLNIELNWFEELKQRVPVK